MIKVRCSPPPTNLGLSSNNWPVNMMFLLKRKGFQWLIKIISSSEFFFKSVSIRFISILSTKIYIKPRLTKKTTFSCLISLYISSFPRKLGFFFFYVPTMLQWVYLAFLFWMMLWTHFNLLFFSFVSSLSDGEAVLSLYLVAFNKR